MLGDHNANFEDYLVNLTEQRPLDQASELGGSDVSSAKKVEQKRFIIASPNDIKFDNKFSNKHHHHHVHSQQSNNK